MTLDVQTTVLVCRLAAFGLVLLMLTVSATSPLLKGGFWRYWIGFVLLMMVRDVWRISGLAGMVPHWADGMVLLVTMGLVRYAFAAGFFALDRQRFVGTWLFSACLGLAGLDLVLLISDQENAVTDPAAQVGLYLTALFYVYVIATRTRRHIHKMGRVCMVGGIAFGLRQIPWLFLEATNVIDRSIARLGSQVWSGLTAISTVMCFIVLVLAIVAKEKEQLESQAAQALAITATYMERTNVRCHRENGTGLRGTEPVTQPRIGAGQVR